MSYYGVRSDVIVLYMLVLVLLYKTGQMQGAAGAALIIFSALMLIKNVYFAVLDFRHPRNVETPPPKENGV